MKIVRFIGGLVVGFLCAAAMVPLSFSALAAAWPEYAAAVPGKEFTLPMLWSRLGIAAFSTLASAAAAILVAGDRRVAWVLGSLFVVASLPSHLHFVWADYPAWYHALYLLYLVPIAWLGGKTVPASHSEACQPTPAA